MFCCSRKVFIRTIIVAEVLFIYSIASTLKQQSSLNGRVLFSCRRFNYCLFLDENFATHQNKLLFPDNFAMKIKNLENIFMDDFLVFLLRTAIDYFFRADKHFSRWNLSALERPQNKLTVPS